MTLTLGYWMVLVLAVLCAVLQGVAYRGTRSKWNLISGLVWVVVAAIQVTVLAMRNAG